MSNDKMTPRVPEERPVPDSILTIADLALRQKATEAWRAASLLRRLMEKWETWFCELHTTGDADPGVTILLIEKATACVQAFFKLRVDIPILQQTTPQEALKLFPPQPSSILAHPGFPDRIAWQRDPVFRKAMNEALRRPDWNRLMRELFGLLRTMETAPSTAFVTGTGNGKGKGTAAKKGKGGRPPLAERTPKFQVYDRIRREHEAGTARRDILKLLQGDKDFMEQLGTAKLTIKGQPVRKPNKDLVKNALAFFGRPRNKQKTPAS